MPATRFFESQYIHFLHFYVFFRSFCKQKQHFSLSLSLSPISSHFLLGSPLPSIPDSRIVQIMVPWSRQWYWKRKISERWASKCDATLAAYLQYPLSNAHMPQRTHTSSSPEIAVKIGTFWKSLCSTLAPGGFASVGVAKSMGSPNN